MTLEERKENEELKKTIGNLLEIMKMGLSDEFLQILKLTDEVETKARLEAKNQAEYENIRVTELMCKLFERGLAKAYIQICELEKEQAE